MSENLTHKELDLKIKSKTEDLKFPLKLHLHGKYEYGTLKIDFKYQKEDLPLEKKNEKADLLDIYMFDLKRHISSFVQNVNLSTELIRKHHEKIIRTSALIEVMLMCPSLIPNIAGKSIKSRLGMMMLVREDLLFELIKVEGPKILCHPVVNEIFQEMIADEKYGGLRINKLRESLLLYVYDKPVDEISFPQGRPKIDLGKGIGKSEIYIIYVFLKHFFRWFKIRCSDKEIDNIRELFETEGKEFFSRITKSLKDKYPSRDYGYFENILILGPFQYTSMIINSDKNLKDEFLKMTWQPNKLAKKLLMILLEIKDRTLENILKEGRQKPAS